LQLATQRTEHANTIDLNEEEQEEENKAEKKRAARGGGHQPISDGAATKIK
jgi:hypothetical protein